MRTVIGSGQKRRRGNYASPRRCLADSARTSPSKDRADRRPRRFCVGLAPGRIQVVSVAGYAPANFCQGDSGSKRRERNRVDTPTSSDVTRHPRKTRIATRDTSRPNEEDRNDEDSVRRSSSGPKWMWALAGPIVPCQSDNGKPRQRSPELDRLGLWDMLIAGRPDIRPACRISRKLGSSMSLREFDSNRYRQ